MAMIDDWEDRARRAEDEAATLQCEIDDLRAQLAAEHAAGYRDAVQALRAAAWPKAADYLEAIYAAGDLSRRNYDVILSAADKAALDAMQLAVAGERGEAYAAAADVILEASDQFTEDELAVMRGRVGRRNERLRAVVDAVWPLADERGYRRAVQALRDPPFASVIFESSRLNDFEASQVAEALAVHLESLAAAQRTS